MKMLISAALCLTTLTAANSQTPVAYYPFDLNANDAAGVNHGINNGAILTGERRSNFNTLNSYSFNGTGASINLGADGTLRPTAALTVSAWFILENTAGALSGRCILSCAEASGYNLLYDKATDKLYFQVYRNGAYGDPNASAAPYVNNGWHHIAGTYDGRYTKLYIDGVLMATNDAGSNYPISYSYPFGGVNTYIGAEAQASFAIDPNYYWQGKIDEVKIYHTALTAAQVKANANLLPGSGKAINFTGTNYLYKSSVNGINDFAVNQDFTVDFWFKAPVAQVNLSTGVNSLVNNSNGPINYDVYIFNPPHADAGKIGIQRWDGSNNPFVTSINPVNDDKWHHCAFVRSGGASGSIALYIDGILQATVPDNTGNTLSNYYMRAGGVGCCGYGNFSGYIDELRIWNTGLSATQLRERMCKKITTADVLWNNLTVNYRFDDDDLVGSGSFGTIVNDSKNGENLNATFQAISVPHVTSGASVGNYSAFDYSGNPAVTLAHPQGESLQATVTSGSPGGIHVYCVNEMPNTTTGSANVGGNDRYFGIFVAGGISPQYDVVYNYTGNPNVTGSNESSLLLYKRNNNAASTWTDCGATLNTAANTLTATGQNTEYLLGGGFTTLPVSLFNFEAEKQINATLLKWVTAYEQNNRGFEVQHSTDGINFVGIGFINASGNSGDHQHYSFIHSNPANGKNYYRLKQMDTDNRSSFSKILLVNFENGPGISFYPNPVSDVLIIQAPESVTQLILFDVSGRRIWQATNNGNRTFSINTNLFVRGILLLQTITKEGITASYKLVKQ